MTMIERNGVRLAFEDRGAGKPAFVFVHGWTCDRSFFAPQADHFARRHRVVSVDLRGHGESDKPPGPYPVATFAEDIAEIVEQAQLGKVVAVGHSLGGLIVLQMAASFPDRVAGIVMVDPPPLVPPPERLAALEAMAAALEAGDDGPRRQFIESMFLPTSDRRLIAQITTAMLAAPGHVAAAAMRGAVAFDIAAAASACRAPALLIAANPQRNPPHLVTQRLPNLVLGCTVGAGHFNQLETPDQINAMIEALLRHYL
jgi:pimeloyl-ACP methyl ester carboxylesterase